MLGRKTYTPAEIADARTLVDDQVKAWRAVAKSADAKACARFEAQYFNMLLLAMDRPFVHRVRAVSGKDGNALNEVEVLCESLMLHQGVLTEKSPIQLVPDQSVTGLALGERIALNADQFTRVAEAFLAELDARFRE